MQLRAGYLVDFIARGNSMRPWVPDGSAITLAPMDNPRVGDIALAIHCETPILHRILKIDGETLFLGGDLNGAVQTRTRQEVFGVAVRCVTPDGKHRTLRNGLWNRLMVLAFAPVRLRKRF